MCALDIVTPLARKWATAAMMEGNCSPVSRHRTIRPGRTFVTGGTDASLTAAALNHRSPPAVRWVFSSAINADRLPNPALLASASDANRSTTLFVLGSTATTAIGLLVSSLGRETSRGKKLGIS